MSAANHRTRGELHNREVMSAVIQGVRDGVGVMETARKNGFQSTLVSEAYTIVREAPGLVEQVLSGELTIYKAHQIATQGEMHRCPVCDGKGYVFRKRR